MTISEARDDATGTEKRPEVRRLDEVLVWSALTLPIVAWIAHLTSLASLVQLSCTHPRVRAILHVLTVLLSLVTIASMVVALRYVRWPNGEEASSARASIRFLARVALLVGAINLLLILAEGSYVVFFKSCAAA